MAGPVKLRLVDDNADVRDLLSRMLSTRGSQVIIAGRGSSGSKVVAAKPPRLV